MARAEEKKNKQGRSSSLVLKLNTRLFFRLLGIFLCMDILLAVLTLGGVFYWVERRCAEVGGLVWGRGGRTEEGRLWVGAGGCGE